METLWRRTPRPHVPLLNSEQMYQALRAIGVPTQLVIYPGQFHGLTKPSYLRDRLQRHVEWYDRYLRAGASSRPYSDARSSSIAPVSAYSG